MTLSSLLAMTIRVNGPFYHPMKPTFIRPILLCVALLLVVPLTGCLDWDFDFKVDNNDLAPSFVCQDNTAGYEPEVGGCQISRACGWTSTSSFEDTDTNFVGSVVCYGQEGGSQECSCAEASESESILHSFEFTGACTADADARAQMAQLCGWSADPDQEQTGIDTHTGDQLWMVTIESARVARSNLKKDSQNWDPSYGNTLPDVLVEGYSEDELTGNWSTRAIEDSINPTWNEATASYWAFDLVRDGLHLSVFDQDPVINDLIDHCDLEISREDLALGTITRYCSDNVSEITISFSKD